jgi:NADH:ubiquinone oxidoreductase subunit 6 (subunit J)
VIAVFVMAIVSFIMAIWDFVRSEWEEAEKKKWRNRIRYMMIWVTLTIFFLVIFPLLLRQLWVSNYEMFSAPGIFNRVGQILNYTFTLWSGIQSFYWSSGSSVFSPSGTTNVWSDYTL